MGSERLKKGDLMNEIEIRKEKPLREEMVAFLSGARTDFQKTRMSNMNRFRSLLRRRLLELEGVEVKKDSEEKDYGEEWSDEKIEGKLDEALAHGKLSEEDVEYTRSIFGLSEKFNEEEKAYEKMFLKEVSRYPIWNTWLKRVKGIGAVHAITLISYLGDCSQFATRSKLWAYAGYKVEDGHAVKRERGKLCNWNPDLKTRCFLIGDSFIKVRNKYRVKVYDKTKERLKLEHPEPELTDKKSKEGKPIKKYTPIHIERMARRKMVKLFLSHYWEVARKLANLPVDNAWAVEHGHHNAPPEEFLDKPEVVKPKREIVASDSLKTGSTTSVKYSIKDNG